MRLVDERDDLPVLQEPGHRPVELLGGGDDDPAAAGGKERGEPLAGLRLLDAVELGRGQRLVYLLVELLAVDDDEHGRVPEPDPQKLPGGEHHRQRLPGAGGVPDDATLDLAVEDALHELVGRPVLVCAGELLDGDALARLEDDEVNREVDELCGWNALRPTSISSSRSATVLGHGSLHSW